MTGTDTDPRATKIAKTARGEVEYIERGEGDPVLFVHGSPGGADQGALMGAFLVDAGYRVIALSRPGYLGTPFDETNATPHAQADLEAALLDSLGIDRCSLICWSGGGPSSYRLAATHPERVAKLVAVAAVSTRYTFEHPGEERLLTGRFGAWMMGELVRHAPKQVIKMTAKEEGDLTKEQVRELSAHIWDDQAKRDFVLAWMGTVTGARKAGFENDRKQFPQLDGLDLASITSPTLLVHGTADADVPPDHSEHALGQVPAAEILRVENGTHVAAWTDPTSDEIQARIATFLRP